MNSQSLMDDVLSLLDWPAAIAAGGEEIIAQNSQWIDATGCRSEADAPLSLADSLRSFTPTNELFETLCSESMSAGTLTVSCVQQRDTQEQLEREYVLRWRQLPSQTEQKSNVILILQDNPASEHFAEILGSQQALINRLLVRQTLIEETERRKFGRSLHDVVIQDLAQIRKSVLAESGPGSSREEVVARIDQIITDARFLMFELSPPVLEDLGLAPALEWLAEYLSSRYEVKVSIAHDLNENMVSKPVRIILFRAVRELATNAAKHAPDSEIIISCVSNNRAVRTIVVDGGPGFDTTLIHRDADGMKGFGLLSVEQQIRGIGGTFDLISSIKSGTRATITVPARHKH